MAIDVSRLRDSLSLDEVILDHPSRSSCLKIPSGGNLQVIKDGNSCEILILQGEILDEAHSAILEQGTYLFIPEDDAPQERLLASSSAIIFRYWSPSRAPRTTRICLSHAKADLFAWSPVGSSGIVHAFTLFNEFDNFLSLPSLHAERGELVQILDLPPGSCIPFVTLGNGMGNGLRGSGSLLEIFVIEGQVELSECGILSNWSWIRIPAAEALSKQLLAADEPAKVFLKCGHLQGSSEKI